MHEKGLQRQIAVGTLVNSQQRRALAVPVINRGQTGYQPVINRLSTGRFVPPPVYLGFPLFVLAKRRSEQLFTAPWRARGTVAFRADRNVGTLFCPGSPRLAVRYAPCRPDPPVVCPGFGLDRFWTRQVRLSTGRCVPPSVYIGIRVFVSSGGHSGQLSTIPWGAG